MVNCAVILKFINIINLHYFIKKLQHNANIPYRVLYESETWTLQKSEWHKKD